MNLRIKELAVQVGFKLPNNLVDSVNGPGVVTEKDKLEKFAELIVERFDLILVNEYLDCIGENDKKSQFRIDRLRKRVKEYFGVE